MVSGETREEWVDEAVSNLGDYLAGQRWFHAAQPPGRGEVHVVRAAPLPDTSPPLWQVLVGVGDDVYQLILAPRSVNGADGGAPPADAEPGGVPARSLIASVGDVAVHDVLSDPQMALALLESISGGSERAERCRLLSAEQSNTSLIFDDRLILKVFRRLRRGRNPDAEVTSALAATGFTNVATPLVEWRDHEYDFAFGQTFLNGGSEGWALALASLRDFYSFHTESPGNGPGEAGGDFGPEAARLGQVTAKMHLHLAQVYPPVPSEDAATTWAALLQSIRTRLAAASNALGRDLEGLVAGLLERAANLEGPGPATRVHGDLHLGQVMRTDLGWFVLDFEGEPDRPLSERLAPASPLKDVAGMLRSLHYASRYSLGERDRSEWPLLGSAALAWELRNREEFLAGYEGEPGLEVLLPDAYTMSDVMSIYELDKALYELDYELAHRPEWVDIPIDALERLGLPDERGFDDGGALPW